MLRGFLFSTLLCIATHTFIYSASPPVTPVATQLKQRQPHWSPKIIETYPEGGAQRVLFYEQIGEENAAPVKQILFYPNGQIKTELDLIDTINFDKGVVGLYYKPKSN